MEADKMRALENCNGSYKGKIIDKIIFTDATETGRGATNGNQEISGIWNQNEATKHINF